MSPPPAQVAESSNTNLEGVTFRCCLTKCDANMPKYLIFLNTRLYLGSKLN